MVATPAQIRAQVTFELAATERVSSLLRDVVYGAVSYRSQENPAGIRQLAGEASAAAAWAGKGAAASPTVAQQLTWAVADHFEAVLTGSAGSNDLVLVVSDGADVTATTHGRASDPYVRLVGRYERSTFLQLAAALDFLDGRLRRSA